MFSTTPRRLLAAVAVSATLVSGGAGLAAAAGANQPATTPTTDATVAPPSTTDAPVATSGTAGSEASATPATAVPPPTSVVPPTTTAPDDEGSDEGHRAGDLVRTISVAGTGTATVTPDQATIQLGARAQRETGSEALAALGENSTALINALEGLGIEPTDIRTTDISLYPTTNRQGKINGYEASTSVSVLIKDLDSVGDVVDGVAALVGDDLTMSGIYFSVSDTDAAMAEARADAVAEARAHADQYAAAAGIAVGDVVTISESSVTPYVPVMYERAASDEDTAAGPSVAIAPGESELSVTVSIVYEIA